jgi:hypothetical protein
MAARRFLRGWRTGLPAAVPPATLSPNVTRAQGQSEALQKGRVDK